MAKYHRIIEHLPSLYRPDVDDSGLLADFLKSIGSVLDEANVDMNAIMQAHWYKFSDKAQFDHYFNLKREVQGLEIADPNKPDDQKQMNTFPYLLDLARLGALLPLSPWREPLPLKEGVEQFRERVKDYINLYRQGLGTVNALRLVTEAELPPDYDVTRARRDRSFSIEESIRLVSVAEQFETRGGPSNIVGPLMRWDFTNAGIEAAPVTAYLKAVATQADIDAAENPMLELYASDLDALPLGIAYQGTIEPGKTLRLSPAYNSWLFGEAGLQQAVSQDDETASGAWQSVDSAPAATVTCLHQTDAEKMLWMAVEDGGAGQLWHYNGREWLAMPISLPAIHCMKSEENELLIATADGLYRMNLFPVDGNDYLAEQVTESSGKIIFDLLKTASGKWWLASGDGVYEWDVASAKLVAVALQGTEIYCLAQDSDGVRYAGGELGLFQYQSGNDGWHWYCGEENSDQIADWNKLDVGILPDAAQVFLPLVNSVYVGRDGALWIGTKNGLARYIASSVGGYAYKTMLEAYPDLLKSEVYSIREDCRGLIWFCTGRGLFRFDGRDIAQYISNEDKWMSCGHADMHYGIEGSEPIKRPAFRFDRSQTAWQSFNDTSGWETFAEPVSSNEEQLVRAVLWTDSVAAHLGIWDGESFEAEAGISLSELHLRCKPEAERIVDAGLVSIPRMPMGTSSWRYLSMEPAAADLEVSKNRPWWSTEGRLFPDPDSDLDDPFPGRHRIYDPAPAEADFEQVFAYNPAVEISLQWKLRKPLTALVRLQKRETSEAIHPAVLDRVWQGIEHVRPVGVKVLLAVENDIVKGESS